MQDVAPSVELHGFSKEAAEKISAGLLDILKSKINSKPELSNLTVSVFPCVTTGISGHLSLVRFYGTIYLEHYIIEALKEMKWEGKFEFIKVEHTIILKNKETP